jgi:hypothetical protein
MVRFERRELLAERHNLAYPETNKGADYLSDCIGNMGAPRGDTWDVWATSGARSDDPDWRRCRPLAKEPKEKLIWWMRPSDAVHLLEGEHVKAFRSMEDSLGPMKLLKWEDGKVTGEGHGH